MMDFIAALLSCKKSRAWDELEKLLGHDTAEEAAARLRREAPKT